MEPMIKKEIPKKDSKFVPVKECLDCNFYLNKKLGCFVKLKMGDQLKCFKR